MLRALVSGALLVGLILVGAAGIAWAGGVAYEQNVPVKVANETTVVEQNYSAPTNVSAPGYALTVYDNETVNASGSTLVEGTDYDWYLSNTTIRWYNTTNTTDGANATLTYWYDARIEAGRNARAIVDPVLTLALPAGLLLALAGSVAGLAIGVWRLGQRSRTNLGR